MLNRQPIYDPLTVIPWVTGYAMERRRGAMRLSLIARPKASIDVLATESVGCVKPGRVLYMSDHSVILPISQVSR